MSSLSDGLGRSQKQELVAGRPGTFQQYAIGWMPGMSLSGWGLGALGGLRLRFEVLAHVSRKASKFLTSAMRHEGPNENPRAPP